MNKLNRKRFFKVKYKTFYFLELKKKSLLEDLLLKGYPDLLEEILQDDFYSFNKNFVFEYILKLINDKEYLKSTTKDTIEYNNKNFII